MSSYKIDEKPNEIYDGATPGNNSSPAIQPIPPVPPPPQVCYYNYPINPNDAHAIEKRNQKYYKNASKHLDYSKDYGYSVTFLVLGIFFIVPLLFNVLYIRSPNNIARNISFASLILFSCYFVVSVILILVAAFAMESNRYHDNYYYRY